MKLKIAQIPEDSSASSVIFRVLLKVADLFSKLPFDVCQSFELRFTTGLFPINIAIAEGVPKHLQLTYLRNESDDTPPTAGVFVDWLPDGSSIRIRGITGLTANKQYTARFLVYG